jgi:hypothetical protein
MRLRPEPRSRIIATSAVKGLRTSFLLGAWYQIIFCNFFVLFTHLFLILYLLQIIAITCTRNKKMSLLFPSFQFLFVFVCAFACLTSTIEVMVLMFSRFTPCFHKLLFLFCLCLVLSVVVMLKHILRFVLWWSLTMAIHKVLINIILIGVC